MVSCGVLVRMHAKHGKDSAVEEFLHSALPLAQDEPGTVAWFAIRFGRGEYGIFDVFADDAARDAHLAGPIVAELKRRASELLDTEPRIQKLAVLADKIPVVASPPDTKGLMLTFKAKSGHEQDVEQFFQYVHELVIDELSTTAWFALRISEREYGVFNVSPSNEDRFVHLVGRVPREYAKQAFTLMSSMPDVEMLNILAEKISIDVQ